MKQSKFISVAFLAAGILFAQGLKITHMEGTYDLDGDGLQEFASVESGYSKIKNYQ